MAKTTSFKKHFYIYLSNTIYLSNFTCSSQKLVVFGLGISVVKFHYNLILKVRSFQKLLVFGSAINVAYENNNKFQ